MKTADRFSARSLLAGIAATLVIAGAAFSLPSANAQQGQTAPKQTTEATTTPPAEPASKGIPVPDMPVVKTETLEGGLIVEDLKIGDGYEIKAGDAVVAFYHGTRKSDGHVFDSAFNRGEPLGFSLNGVIQGWSKGVPGMKVGGIRRLTIPSALGYGATGSGPDIPANTDLVFVIQIVDALHVEDVHPGTGAEVGDSFVAVTTHTTTDKDGKEVEKADAANPCVWIPNEYMVQRRFDLMAIAMKGMKIGGTRKVHLPAGLNQPNPGLSSTRPGNIDLNIELTLVALRNLPSRGR